MYMIKFIEIPPMDRAPTVRIERKVQIAHSPQPSKTVSYSAIEELDGEDRVLDSYPAVLSSEQNCYQNAFLASLKYARRHDRFLRDDIAGLKPAKPKELLSAEAREPVRSIASPPSGVAVCRSDEGVTIELQGDRSQTYGAYFFMLLLAPVAAFGWFTLEDRVNQIGITFFISVVILAIFYSEREQKRYHGQRRLILEPDKIIWLGADKKRTELKKEQLIHIAAHDSGLTLFSEESGVHFPEANVETSRWLRAVVLDDLVKLTT